MCARPLVGHFIPRTFKCRNVLCAKQSERSTLRLAIKADIVAGLAKDAEVDAGPHTANHRSPFQRDLPAMLHGIAQIRPRKSLVEHALLGGSEIETVEPGPLRVTECRGLDLVAHLEAILRRIDGAASEGKHL